MIESREIDIVDKKIKIFKDLDKEIIQSGKCCSCGACVAYCESQSFDVIKMEDYTPKFKSDQNAEKCTECGLCFYICPQTYTLITQMNNLYQLKDELGHIIKIIAAKTTEKSIEIVGQDGGVVSTILYHLFSKNKIDGAIVSEYDENLKPNPKIIYSKEDLLNSAGTRYSISSQILPLKDLYTISSDITKKKGILDIEQLRIAFVGTPCQVRAISKMKFLNIKPSHVVKYVISLFCFENFNHEKLYNIIMKETKVKPENIKKTWIKKNFFIQDKSNKQYEINIKTLEPAVRQHCDMCDDFTGKFSDISVGASGAPNGYSMVVSRTQKGNALLDSLFSSNLIQDYQIPLEQVKEWKEKKVNTFKRMISLKTKK